MDLYPIALAFYGLLLIATFASLKSAMKQIMHDQRIENGGKNVKLIDNNHQRESQKKQKGETCRIFKYLMRSYTIALLFGCKLGTSMLLIVFTYSMVALSAYFTTFWYPSAGFGCIVSLVTLIAHLLQQKYLNSQNFENEQELRNKKWRLKKVIYCIIGLTTIAFFLALFGLCYKNYINSRLKYMMTDFCIAFSIDNFAVKPFVFLTVALITSQNTHMINIVNKDEQDRQVSRVRVANELDRPETKHHFVINLEVEPQPIELNKSKEFNRSKVLQVNNHGPQALPSSSIIDTIEINHEGSIENMISRVQSNKTALNKMTSMKELNEIQLEKIEENPGQQLHQYFCLNLRRSRQIQQSKHLQKKLQTVLQNKENQQTADLVKQFILQDFICCSPKNEENNHSKEHEQAKSKYSKSKGSLRGVKTFRILEKENQAEFDEKENTFAQSTKHQISETEVSGHRDCSFSSNGRRLDNKTHILKISDTEKQSGELQEIDINSPNKRIAQKTSYDTHVIPEEDIKSKSKRHRRRTTKDISQPYLLQDKLIEIYFPGKNKSDLDNFVRSKKKNFDRSQFFNHSNKKQHSKGRDKPIVHQNDEHHTEFFVPKF